MLSLLSLLSSKNDNSELVKTQNFASQQIIHHKQTIAYFKKDNQDNLGQHWEICIDVARNISTNKTTPLLK
jgi:hypothetical protein